VDEVAIPFRKPLALIGGLEPTDQQTVRDFLVRFGAPVYAEPLSGLREDDALRDLLITAGERMPGRGDFDGVVRLGNVPTLRFWRDLDESRQTMPVISFSRLRFTGLARGEVHPIESLPKGSRVAPGKEIFAHDRRRREEIERILDSEPESELTMLRTLSRELPRSSRIYLGNSLPIREWDLVATRESRSYAYEGNRGANGIDGQLSTFLGWCAPAASNVAVLGDLTTLYDLNAPWIVPQLDATFRIVIVNNGGGRIFDRVASLAAMNSAVRARIIDNAHALRFDQWATMWGITDQVTELRPDLAATRRVWQRYDDLWR
jgi:2-succinyl-5-enolpyruvyl-6-hydroxy-3-cyclohexene-1-carboxylate synthase